MIRMLIAAVTIMTIVAISGCGSSSSMSRLNDGITAGTPTDTANIKVYASREIGREYIEMGSVSVSVHNELDGRVYIQRIKEAAAKIGADAVVGYTQLGTSAAGIAVRFK